MTPRAAQHLNYLEVRERTSLIIFSDAHLSINIISTKATLLSSDLNSIFGRDEEDWLMFTSVCPPIHLAVSSHPPDLPSPIKKMGKS